MCNLINSKKINHSEFKVRGNIFVSKQKYSYVDLEYKFHIFFLTRYRTETILSSKKLYII